MKRFKFRLQAVLEQRKRIENQAKKTYADAQQALQKGNKLLLDLEGVRTGLIEEISALRNEGNFNPEEARLYGEYIQTVNKCIKEQQDWVAELGSTAEAFRLRLVGAAQDLKIVDKLKERDLNTYVTEDIREQQAECDELTTTRHSLKLPGDIKAA
jgi:flagellar export protein FliJ